MTEPGLDAETRDAIRILCFAVGQLATLCAPLIGPAPAKSVVDIALMCSERMDTLDAEAAP